MFLEYNKTDLSHEVQERTSHDLEKVINVHGL